MNHCKTDLGIQNRLLHPEICQSSARTFALPPRRRLVPDFVGITRGVKDPERPVYLGDIRVAAVGKPFEVPLVRSSLPVVHSEADWLLLTGDDVGAWRVVDHGRLAKIREDHIREWSAWRKSVALQKPRLEWADEEETVHEVGEASGKPVKSRWHIQAESELDAAFTHEPDITEQFDFGPVAKPGNLIMGRWTAPYVPQRPLEWCPAKWMRWLGWTRFPSRTRHNPYLRTRPERILDKQGNQARGYNLGFRLDERGKPASTYVKYGRMKPDGAVGAPIEDDDAWRLEAMMDARPIEPDSEAVDVVADDHRRKFPHPSIPADCTAWRQWWARVWEIRVYTLGNGFIMFVGSFFWLGPAPMAWDTLRAASSRRVPIPTIRNPRARDMATPLRVADPEGYPVQPHARAVAQRCVGAPVLAADIDAGWRRGAVPARPEARPDER
jgi:hypothetical protein